jgi:ACT domain-containing protein
MINCIDAKIIARYLCGMQQDDLIKDIVASAAIARVSIPEACRYAGIAPSTFYRWRDGSEASLRRIHAVRDAIDAIKERRF